MVFIEYATQIKNLPNSQLLTIIINWKRPKEILVNYKQVKMPFDLTENLVQKSLKND